MSSDAMRRYKCGFQNEVTTQRYTSGSHTKVVRFMTCLLCRAPVHDVVAWGESLDHLLECKSKLTWIYASHFCEKTLLSQFSVFSFHPRNSLAARRRISSWIALGLLRRIMDIFSLQVRPIHSEIYLRRMTLAEIRGPNLSCQRR